MIFPQDRPEIDNHIKPDVMFCLIQVAGKCLKGLFLRHFLAVVAETVHIPVTIRAQVNLPIPPASLHPDEGFKTAVFPKTMTSAAWVLLPGNMQFMDIPRYMILQQQGIGLASDCSGYGQAGPDCINLRAVLLQDESISAHEIPNIQPSNKFLTIHKPKHRMWDVPFRQKFPFRHRGYTKSYVARSAPGAKKF